MTQICTVQQRQPFIAHPAQTRQGGSCVLLNCDLGESYGKRVAGDDYAVMPHIDQASIACGFHGGDPLTIVRALDLALQHNVQIGAHPSYPDLQGFGRRSMTLPAPELIAGLHYQIAALDGMARSRGVELSYVKPHGALYNDMMRDPSVRATVLAALASFERPLPLVLQAMPRPDEEAENPQRLLQQEVENAGIQPLFEAFADRRYLTDGSLMPRSEPGAVLHHDDIVRQVQQLTDAGSVTSATGDTLQLNAQTLCVHGDNPAAVLAVKTIRSLVDG